MTPKEALAELQKCLKAPTETVPEGWYTSAELAEQWHKSHSLTCKLLNKGLEAGHCEQAVFRIKTGRIIRPVPHWRFIKKVDVQPKKR